MSKKGSSKTDWAAMDKRIRDRRPVWTAEELEQLHAALLELPDVAEKAEFIDIAQPALASAQPSEEGEAQQQGEGQQPPGAEASAAVLAEASSEQAGG